MTNLTGDDPIEVDIYIECDDSHEFKRDVWDNTARDFLFNK